MVKQNDKGTIIKIDADGSGRFDTLISPESTKITLNADMVDMANLDSAGGWRRLLQGDGLRNFSITAMNVPHIVDTGRVIQEAFITGDLPQCQLIVPNVISVWGAVQITRLEYNCSHKSDTEYDLQLVSAGPIGFEQL